MRKIILFIALLCLPFGLVVKAEEEVNVPDDTVQEGEVIPEDEITIPEELIPEDVEVTLVDQVEDFMNKWFTPVLGSVMSMLGTLVMYLLCKKKVFNFSTALNTISEDSIKNRNENLKTLEDVKKALEAEKKQLKEEQGKAIKELEKAKEQLLEQVLVTKELLQQSIHDKDSISMLKDLLVLAVSSNPQFATSEAGQKMLGLLNEYKED